MTPLLANNLKVQAELLQLLTALNDAGVEPVVLKGVPLVRALYGRLDGRFIGDNDLLVIPEQLHAALATLKSLGYRARAEYPELALRHDGRASFVRDRPRPARIDLHLSAFEPRLYPVPAAEVWAEREAFELDGCSARVLGKPAALLHLAAHFVQHHCAERRVLGDVARAWNEWGDPALQPRLRDLARHWGLIDTLMFSLWAAVDLGLLQRGTPAFPAPRASALRRVLPSHELFNGRSPYLRAALMAALIEARHWPAFARSYLIPPASKLDNLRAGASPVQRAWVYGARLLRPLLGTGSLQLRDEA